MVEKKQEDIEAGVDGIIVVRPDGKTKDPPTPSAHHRDRVYRVFCRQSARSGSG
jgi:hypothetical protein